MKTPSRLRALWHERDFLRQTAVKFRLKPHYVRLLRKRSARSPFDAPPAVILQLTEACNLRCRMCYEWGETGHQRREGHGEPAVLPLDAVESLLADCRGQRTFYSLFGGEPLLYPDLDRIIEGAKRFGSAIESVTNGTLIADRADMLVETGLDLIRVSLDGPREVNDRQRGRGSYDRAVVGLEKLFETKARARRSNPLVGIVTTVTPENYTGLEKLFCSDLDLRWIDFVTIQMQTFVTESMGRAYEHLLRSEFGQGDCWHWKGMLRDPGDFSSIDIGELIRQFRGVRSALLKRGIFLLPFPNTWRSRNLSSYLAARWREMADYKGHCIAPWVVTDVTASGDVAPCHTFYDLTLGNIRTTSIGEIWNGEAFNRFRGHMQDHLLPVCPACCQFYGYP